MPRGTHPNSLANLKRGNRFTKETATKEGKKGAAASNEVQAKRRSLKEELEIQLQTVIEKKDATGKVIGTSTVQGAVTTALLQKAMKGNVRAYEAMRDTLGEKPADTVIIAGISDEIMKEVDCLVEQSGGG